MASTSAFFVFFFWLLSFSLSFLSNVVVVVVRSQEYSERGPHGLAQESPETFSPEAFKFFHPDSPLPSPSCADSAADCAPMSSFFKPMATKVRESADESPVAGGANSRRRNIGAGGAVGIVFGCLLAVVLAMGTYHVLVTRRRNISRAYTVHPPPV
ncbi:hypothetical protein H6P81_011718 [Aristolochia fimbriata]|uniref:Transmembrane protein n=1 Tax=Aristolochia fimbriata TaxID=158543 RepID=A0AAV7E9R3_ARIFI|nr:hypothetical protein H6P81_011718 [Aristolochia fimbriata]